MHFGVFWAYRAYRYVGAWQESAGVSRAIVRSVAGAVSAVGSPPAERGWSAWVVGVGGRRGWSAWVVGAVKQSEAASEAASEIERQKPRASPIATGSVTVRSPRGASREIEHGLRWVSRRGQGGRFGGFSDVVQDFVNDIWLSFCDEAQHTHIRATDGA